MHLTWPAGRFVGSVLRHGGRRHWLARRGSAPWARAMRTRRARWASAPSVFGPRQPSTSSVRRSHGPNRR
eukprot:8288613-Lingulodinium_polyedra.AAC.1